MVRAGVWITVGPELLVRKGIDANEGEFMDRMLSRIGQIVRKVESADRNGLVVRVVNLEPIVAGSRVGHPLVDFEVGGIAESRGRVRAAQSDKIQHPIAAAVGEAADREVRRLNTEFDAAQLGTAVRQLII